MLTLTSEMQKSGAQRTSVPHKKSFSQYFSKHRVFASLHKIFLLKLHTEIQPPMLHKRLRWVGVKTNFIDQLRTNFDAFIANFKPTFPAQIFWFKFRYRKSSYPLLQLYIFSKSSFYPCCHTRPILKSQPS